MKPLITPHFDLFEVRDGDGWHKVSSTHVYDDPHLQVERADYLTPGRPLQPVTWTIVHRKPAVAVAPVTSEGHYILIAQERLPVQQTLWEFPAGQIDDDTSPNAHQTIIEAALNEMREECGAVLDEKCGVLQPLGWFLPSQGFTTEHVYLFRAGPVHLTATASPDSGEHISAVRVVTGIELRNMIANNEITNALTLALFAKMVAKGLL